MIWRAGEQVGQYEIISELGHGGMATVYKAYHGLLDRHVAIKVMHQNYADDQNFTARFKREAQIVARLEHPHIVPVYDYNEYQGMPYLVMKFIQGRSLKQILFKNPPALDEIIHIMKAVADATTYAHNKGVMHRDIKPSNIVIDNDNVPYLADFGLARIVAAGESTMSADVLLGTPNYMSPEQARGAKDIDHRSDLYSLGIVLYELVVGQVPFSSPTPLAVIQDHIHTPLPRPSQINPDIPPQLEHVLRKALAKKPADRFNSANEMIEAFRDAVRDEHIESVAEDRAEIADDSLARWRARLTEQEDNPGESEDNVARSIRNLAQDTVTDDSIASAAQSVQTVPKPIRTKTLKETSVNRHEPHAQFWMIAGATIFMLSVFLIVAVVLNASNTFMEITDLFNRIEANRTFPHSQNPQQLYYDVPRLKVNEATETISENPNDAQNYLALADAHYRIEDIDEARLALNRGRQLADDLIRYLITASSIADTSGDKPVALVYGILLWDIIRDNTSQTAQLAYTQTSQYLYNQSLETTQINLSRDNIEQLSEIIGSENAQTVIRSHVTRIIVVNNHVEMERQRLAAVTLQLWTRDTHALPIGQLVNARYETLMGNSEAGRSQLNQLVETSTTPAWIVTIARNLLNESKD